MINLPATGDMKLSVVIPVFNEGATIRKLVERVRVVGIPKQIIIVDDCSMGRELSSIVSRPRQM